MASSSGGVPPGFRFHPTDEELLHYYLKKKVTFQKFDMEVIKDVDLNKMEPWELQERCRIGSTPQNEWYFFSHRDRKYPTGSRTNRATNAGFWKATGRDKCIRNTTKKIGMRKTLVFYRGRAPHGKKTDWIMHEYRLEDGDDPQANFNEDGWVVCRVFKKKNLFKVGSDGGAGGGGSTGYVTTSDQLIYTNSGSTNSNQSRFLLHRSDTSSSTAATHQYLLLPQQAAANEHSPAAQASSNFDLYSKTTLGLHSYSNSTMPLLPPLPPHDQYSHHHHHDLHDQSMNIYDFSARFPSDDQSPVLLKQLMTSAPRDSDSTATTGLEVGTCEATPAAVAHHQQIAVASASRENLNEWAMLIPPHDKSSQHEGDPSKDMRFDESEKNDDTNINSSSSIQSMNQQLPLRGEMDFWGYTK